MKIKNLLFFSVVALVLGLMCHGQAFAVDCAPPVSGNYNITGSCAFPNTVDGVDSGTGASNSAVMYINPNVTLTVNAGQTIAFGLIDLRGTIALNSTAQLVKKPLWMKDCNANGTPATTTQTYSSTSPGASYRRRNLLSTITSTDNSDAVDATYKYAWGENIGWLVSNYGFGLNGGGTELTGYLWGENIGWVSLNCSNDNSCGTVDYNVTDTSGTLAGYAWAENAGWISLNCSNTGTCGTVNYGVSVDGSGYFSGYAWAENVGWISFNCSNTNTCGTVDYKVKICQ